MWVFYLSYGVFLLCGLFLYVGARLFQKKQTKKSVVGLALLRVVPILVIIGLALYDFELIPLGVYLGIMFVGLLIQQGAVVIICKQSKD